MLKLRRFLSDYKLQLIVGPLCKLFEAVLELFAPLVMAQIIDNGILKNDTGYVLRMGAVLVLLGVVGLSSALVCQYMASYTSQGAGTKIRTALFRHIGTLSHRELDEIGTPALITRMTSDINAVQANVAMTMRLLLRAPFLIIGALVMACFIDLKISVIFFVAALIIGLILFLVMTKSLPFYKKIQSTLDRISLISRENLSGSRVIRAFSKQKTHEENFEQQTEKLAKTSKRVGRLSALLNPATYVVANSAIVLILYFGAGQVDSGALLSGDIVALASYMTQILLAMIVLADLVVLLARGAASGARINEVFEINPSVKELASKDVIPKEKTPKIEFRNVSFSYGDGDSELEDISFSIDKNSTVGIIGTTGSGKSTLLSLISRYYDAASGEVLVDGVDVKKYPFKQLRSNTAEVPQKSVLFSGTLRENMLWQKPDATDGDIWSALRAAQADGFVDTLDKEVVQGGMNFSGGQRQRLCIARALVGNPSLIILDDSFSALDFATEKKLRKNLCARENTTIIIVTQRCSTIMNADKILVLEDGRLEGQGTHGELIKNCPAYREICLSQLGREEAGL
ncbi:MAG: ABC transporter ATP-binding protein/permease [Ruminococcus sp.]|nr:ABC transporter ATP-binding protein/permease [Ruminococcus sp.]